MIFCADSLKNPIVSPCQETASVAILENCNLPGAACFCFLWCLSECFVKAKETLKGKAAEVNRKGETMAQIRESGSQLQRSSDNNG